MKKNILFIISIFLFLYFTNILFASTGVTVSESTGVTVSEEEECFKLLHENIKTDSRFTSFLTNGLKNVLFNEINNTRVDLDTYEKFKLRLEENPIHKGSVKNERESMGFTKNDFLSRRTNIATIIAKNNFVVSQWVGFGKDSNFTYPLTTNTEPQLGDRWVKTSSNPFKEYVLYTHHNIKGEFMSCGILRVIPLGKNSEGQDRKYSEISESGYFTNILNGIENQPNLGGNKCNSGFEGEKISSSGKNFYKMKTNICVMNYAQKDYLTMQILTISYDNKSSYINEYVAFPLQVRAMKDTGLNPTGGLVSIRNKYLEFLYNNTCFELIHPSKSTLPSFCGGNYSSNVNIRGLYSYENEKNKDIKFSYSDFINFLFPEVHAARKFINTEQMVEESKGMVVFENFPYEKYKKILELKDENFKTYLLVSLEPQFEKYINYKKENGILLTPYERVFDKCGIKYEDRVNIVIDLIDKYEDLNKLDYKNISYKDPNFGNCIIPYPDKTNISKIIDNSFESNKILAKKIQGIYKDSDIPIDPVIENYTKDLYEITNKYNQNLIKLSKDFNNGNINLDQYNSKLKDFENIYNNDIEMLNNKYKDISKNQLIDNVLNSVNKKSEKNRSLYYIYILVAIIGFFLIIISFIIRKQKNK